MAVSFIGGGNRSTQSTTLCDIKFVTCGKSVVFSGYSLTQVYIILKVQGFKAIFSNAVCCQLLQYTCTVRDIAWWC
jgi:hypothetical protein